MIRLIEFDGPQHTEGADNFFEDTTLALRDKQKNDYAYKKGIPLVRIPYYKRDTLVLDDLLTNKFLV